MVVTRDKGHNCSRLIPLITVHSFLLKFVDVLGTLVKFRQIETKPFGRLEQLRWTVFIVTRAFFAIAFESNLAVAVKRTFGIVALSIDITVVRIGGTLVYICWKKLLSFSNES